jgi:hypothetical protein
MGFVGMKRGLRAVTVLGAGMLAAQIAFAEPVSRSLNFADSPGTVTVRGESAEVTLQPIAAGEGTIEVSASIRVPGYRPIVVSEGFASSAYSTRWIGIGRLSPSDPAPAVLLAGFTGGAHCCATLKAIVPYAGGLRVLEFQGIDGPPEESFPRDIDGDGTVEILRQDDSFRYQFASGAGSFSPPVIYNISEGAIVDVSTRPSLRRVWEAFAEETRARCADQADDDRNGACAAFVAASARLGRFNEALFEAESHARRGGGIELPPGCNVQLVDGICPGGAERRFADFSTALRWFLTAHDYIGR